MLVVNCFENVKKTMDIENKFTKNNERARNIATR